MYPFGGPEHNAPNNQYQPPNPYGGYPPQQSNVPYPNPNGPAYPPHLGQPTNQAPYPSHPGLPTNQVPYPNYGQPAPVANHLPYPGSVNTQTPYPPQTQYPPQQQQQQQYSQGYPPSQMPYQSQPPYQPAQPTYPPQGHMAPAAVGQTCAAVSVANNYGQMNNQPNVVKNQLNPTVSAAPNFDPAKDANDLRKAMKGFGTDENTLIEIICKRTNHQRQEIQRKFKTLFGKDLIDEIKSETSGNFEKLLVGLLLPTVEFYCHQLCDAMKGVGTDEDVIIEMLCTLSNMEIITIKNQYHRMYGSNLESELKSETSGHFERLLVSLCAAGRDESGRIDPVAAQADARDLLNAGEKCFGTDESTFNMILCHRNYAQLKLVFEEYIKLQGHSLEKAIKKEFSGDIEKGLLAIYKCVMNKSEYFATRLHKSMAGLGTNDKQLIRLIITRCEIDMKDIKIAFEKLYGKSLKSWIKGEASGHYKHALYTLIGEPK